MVTMDRPQQVKGEEKIISTEIIQGCPIAHSRDDGWMVTGRVRSSLEQEERME